MSKEIITPLSEANEYVSNRLRVNLRLPFGLEEEVGINIDKTDKLRRLAGFGKVAIVRDDDLGTSQYIPQIDGVNADGSIISRKAGIKTAPTGTHEFDNKNERHNRAYWPNLKIKINVEEIKQRILDSENGNVRDKSEWGKLLDKTIRENLVKGGTKHLLNLNKPLSYPDLFDTFCFYAAPFLINGFRLNFDLVQRVICNSLVFNSFNTMEDGFEGKTEGYRLSLTLGPEVERALALNIYGRLGKPVIKPITETK